MSLISFESIQTAFRRTECIKSRRRLGDNEWGVSSQAFPGLYKKNPGKKEKEYIAEVIKELSQHRDETDGWDPREREDLRLFLLMTVDAGATGIELFLHTYLYLFWDKVEFKDVLINPKRNCVIHVGEGRLKRSKKKDCERDREIAELIVASGVQVDLICVDESAGIVYLIEIKLGELDDRAVGQVLRYYKKVNSGVLFEKRQFNINYVKPMLIVANSAVSRWIGRWEVFSESQRDVIDIFAFRICKESKNLILQNTRKALLTEKYDRLRRGTG